MKAIEFITLAEVIDIHKDQIDRYGGIGGLRDITLLQSALAMPETSFESNYLHEDYFQMASAYAFHICQNHPFIDGNKRVALVVALIFLDINGIEIDDPNEVLYKTMMSIASGKMNKEILAQVFRSLSEKSH